MQEILIGLSVVLLAFLTVATITRNTYARAFKKVATMLSKYMDTVAQNFSPQTETIKNEDGSYEYMWDMEDYTVTIFFSPLNQVYKIVHQQKREV